MLDENLSVSILANAAIVNELHPTYSTVSIAA
jgi:hypothetical protein